MNGAQPEFIGGVVADYPTRPASESTQNSNGITNWRKGFAYQAPVPVWIFIAALAFVAAVTFGVVTLQSWRAANANPVDSLKNE